MCIRDRYNINILALKKDGKLDMSITPDTQLCRDESMLVLYFFRILISPIVRSTHSGGMVTSMMAWSSCKMCIRDSVDTGQNDHAQVDAEGAHCKIRVVDALVGGTKQGDEQIGRAHV